MLRPDFVRRKLHLIAEDLGHLLEFKHLTREELSEEPIRLAAVERLLERLVMRAIDANEHLITELATGEEERISRLTYRDTFLRLAALGVYPQEFAERIAKSAGLRNILVHDYNDVDREILHRSISSALEDYRAYLEHMERFLTERESSEDEAHK